MDGLAAQTVLAWDGMYASFALGKFGASQAEDSDWGSEYPTDFSPKDAGGNGRAGYRVGFRCVYEIP